MKISYTWLQDFFDNELPPVKELAESLTFHAFEVEEMIEAGGDTVIDVDMTPNRAHDCLSYIGVAKEVAAIFDMELHKNPLREFRGALFGLLRTQPTEEVSIEVEDNTLCSRYSAVTLKDIKLEESPEWLKKYLYSMDQQSINNLVDVTNYVMFETGQPLHAFDLDKMSEDENGRKSIGVRPAVQGESIICLDDNEYVLEAGELLIVDGVSDVPLGIAGVKGGKKAEIDENTKRVVLESANFNSSNIRNTSIRLDLKTEASIRFEYEITPEITEAGLLEAIRVAEDAIGATVGGYKDIYPNRANPYLTGVSLEEINSLLGVNVERSQVGHIFRRLGFSYEIIHPSKKVTEEAEKHVGAGYKYGARVSCDAPDVFDCSGFVSFAFSRAGISLPRMAVDQYVFGKEVSEADLSPGDVIFMNTGKEVEGVIRYESVEFMKGTKVPEGVDHSAIYLGEGKMIHSSRGKGGVVAETIDENGMYKNIVGYRRIIAEKERFVISVPPERLDVRIPEDLIEEVGRIYGYKNIDTTPPEMGEVSPQVSKGFYYREKIKDILVEEGFSEVMTYVFWDRGEIETLNPIASDKSFLRSNLMHGVEEALEDNFKNADLLALNQIKIFEMGKVFTKEGEYERLSIAIKDTKKRKGENKAYACLQKIVEKIEKDLGVKFNGKIKDKNGDGATCIIEEDLEELIAELETPSDYSDLKEFSLEKHFHPISQYPYVLRDIAVWTPEGTESEELLSLIVENVGGLLVNHKLFDEFHREGSVSYAFRLVFQSQNRTLSDEEVNVIMENINKVIEQKEGWQVR